MTLAIIVFMLVMGSGMAWNFFPSAVLQNTTHANPVLTSVPTSSATSFSTTSSSHSFISTGVGGTTTQSPQQTPPRSTATHLENLTAWRQEWLSYSQIAWAFFKPGVGVSPTTGLIYASPYWHRFTDWDLGGYIEAVLSAQKLGLIGANGTWGAEYRLNLVLNFLDARPLAPKNITFQFYDSDTGTVSPDGVAASGDIIDEGKLLISLYDTMLLHPELTDKVELAVHHVNYTYFASSNAFNSDEAYPYYAFLGFQLWNFSTDTPPAGSAPQTNSFIEPEPIMLAIMEHASDAYFNQTGYEAYLAQYAAYNRTGVIFALSEGQYPPYFNSSTPYVYEYIEVPGGSNFSVQSWNGITISNPEMFTKIAFAYYAVYKSNYGLALLKILGNLSTPNGYEEGMLPETNQVFGAVSDNTNIMIMEACSYAIESV